MEIFRIKSRHPKTEYAPSWNFPVGVAGWQDFDKIDTIKNWLINKEQWFIDNFPVHHDGKTGLGNNSVTARHGTYNLFHFTNELPELNDWLKFAQTTYLDFVSQDLANVQDLYIFSWFNIARKGDSIGEHAHGADSDSYLSGNSHFDDYDTINSYMSPFDARSQFSFKNFKGSIALFPSCLPHKSDVYNSDTPRVSVAFDLRLAEDMYISNPLATPFMNSEIFQTLYKEKHDLHSS
jgi:hypothetical protein